MILPGVSGAYLLLVLGQYRPIVDAVATAAAGVRAGDAAGTAAALPVLLPVAVGMGLGVVGVSNLVKLLLAGYRRATLGFLLGLLLGSVIGLWPFPTVPSLPKPAPARRWRQRDSPSPGRFRASAATRSPVRVDSATQARYAGLPSTTGSTTSSGTWAG